MIAVIVMFVLLFIGGIFVGLVARNLLNTGRASDTVSADEFARAGIQYADLNLQNSPEGADWRPAPYPIPAVGSPQYAVFLNDPDRRWLEDGYTRLDIGRRGRALIRVSLKYNPLDPLGQYLKVESVGRVGFINPQDPTTFLNTPAPRLRRELVAYKAVGITDYLRYVTNRTNDAKAEAVLGVPSIGVPLAQRFGGLQTRTPGGVTFGDYQTPGARMFINSHLRLMPGTTLYVDPRNHEQIDVAGQIIANDDPNNRPKFINARNPAVESDIFGTDEAGFTTFGDLPTGVGLLRDNDPNPDPSGFARGISRLEASSIDVLDPASGLTRYQMNTRESGLILTNASGQTFNTGRYGFGGGVYIDNFNNTENQTQTRSGGQTYRSLWMSRGESNYWNGPYYNAPGVTVEPGYPIVQQRDADGNLIPDKYAAQPGITIEREDRQWRDPSGTIGPHKLDFVFFIYKPVGRRPVLKLENEFFRSYLKTQYSKPLTEKEVDKFLPEFNGTIYAEGNIRVKGLLPAVQNVPIRRESAGGDSDGSLTDEQIRQRVNPPAVNLVSGQVIYIEGSLVRESQSSLIGLLAKEYVTVNTTKFLTPHSTESFQRDPTPDADETMHLPVSTSADISLDFAFGDDPTKYTPMPGKQPVNLNLLLKHTAEMNGHTYLDLFINEQFPVAGGDSLYRFNVGGPYPNWIYPLGEPGTPTEPYRYNLFEQRPFQLWPKPIGATYTFLDDLAPGGPSFNKPGIPNRLRFAVDQTFTLGEGTRNYLFGRAAFVPMDVRIEAVIYAQNGSFFIIPGYPINKNPSDTPDAALRLAQEQGLPAGTMLRPAGVSPFFPFFNEPVDCRITIVGAVAENRTASASDQAAWMQLWGYIPEVYGSTGKNPVDPAQELTIPREHVMIGEVGQPAPTTDIRTTAEKNARIARGLRFLYDPALSAPYAGYDPGAGTLVTAASGNWKHVDNGSFRQDEFGRILPPIPRLPVCPGFVFYGEVR